VTTWQIRSLPYLLFLQVSAVQIPMYIPTEAQRRVSFRGEPKQVRLSAIFLNSL